MTANQRRCSIIIPHYGAAEPTRQLVAQLRPQLGDADELIVVDDCSPTPFPACPGARVLRREANGGFGSTVNSGARAATGELLLVLNSDLVIPPEFIDSLLAEAAPWQPCVASPKLIKGDGELAPSARHFPKLSHQVIDWLSPLARFDDRRWLREAKGHDTWALDSLRPVPVDWVVGAAMLIPREPFLSIGGFDERFFMNCEEVDLQRRLRMLGIPSVHLPTVTITHLEGGSSNPSLRRKWLVDAQRTYAKIWGGLAALRLMLSAATLVNLAVNTLRRLVGRKVAPVQVARSEFELIWGKPAR